MIYSTCSLSIRQNEDVVRGFLKEHSATAVLEPIDREGIPCQVRTELIVVIQYQASH